MNKNISIEALKYFMERNGFLKLWELEKTSAYEFSFDDETKKRIIICPCLISEPMMASEEKIQEVLLIVQKLRSPKLADLRNELENYQEDLE